MFDSALLNAWAPVIFLGVTAYSELYVAGI